LGDDFLQLANASGPKVTANGQGGFDRLIAYAFWTDFDEADFDRFESIVE
jgi:hypothetical protein